MEAITITVPVIAPETVAAVEATRTEAFDSEVSALAALRTTYGPLAKYGGFVKTGYWFRGNDNWHDQRNYPYSPDGKKAHGLLALDQFEDEHETEYAGRSRGSKLYLLETSAWLLLTRDGHWSQHSGSASFWSCDPAGFGDGNFEDFDWRTNDIVTLTDEAVAGRFDLAEILEELGKSLKKLQESLPQRMRKLRSRAEIAQRLLAALEGK